jgi:hypothetical protein
VLSILIHLLFISAFIGAGRATKSRHDDGLGANEIVSDEEARGILFFVEDPAVAENTEDALPTVASHGKVLQALRLTVVSPDADVDTVSGEPSDAVDHEAVEEASSDRHGMAELYGHYLSQIQARIERAWLRPRSPLDLDDFACRIQIQQNEHGEVGEVTLQKCSEAIPWQLSLVRAIESASPLPAPPDPRIFTKAFELAFHAVPLLPGASDTGYEPASPQTAGHR